MKNIKIILVIIITNLILLLSGCINIKSAYPEAKYYKLTQTPIHSTEAATLYVDKNIYIKPFEIVSDLASSKIVVSEDEHTIKRYNYHQWIAPLNELLAEFTITRFNRYGAFQRGVTTSIYSSTPDYVLECNVLDCSINNSVSIEKPNSVELAISVTFFVADKTSLTYSPIYSKTYTASLARKDNSLETAVDALSILISNIDDSILVDIFKMGIGK